MKKVALMIFLTASFLQVHGAEPGEKDQDLQEFTASFPRPWATDSDWPEKRDAMIAAREERTRQENEKRRELLNRIPDGYTRRCSARLNPDEVTSGALGMIYKRDYK